MIEMKRMPNRADRQTVRPIAFLLILFASLSCSNDHLTGMNGTESGTGSGTNDEAISFAIPALWMETRATTTDYDALQSIGVYGYFTETERWIWSTKNNLANLTANYFCNVELKKSEQWTYSPLRYWPADTRKKISFFAYSPCVAIVEPYPLTDAQPAVPTISYTVPADITEQIDLMYDAHIDMDQTMAPVDFTLKHALTAISLTAKIKDTDVGKYTIAVNSITLSGVYGTGVLDLATGKWTFDDTSAPSDRFVLDGAHLKGETLGNDLMVHPLLSDAAGVLMLHPQGLDEAYLSYELEFTPLSGTPDNVSISFALADLNEPWAAGKAINYELEISGEFISVHTSQVLWIPDLASTGNVEP